MSDQPYDPRLITPSVYGHRRPVRGEVVALLHITFEERGLKLIQSRSRAMVEKEIHELMITDDAAAGPGGGADRVSAIAFFEVERGGLAVVGDGHKDQRRYRQEGEDGQEGPHHFGASSSWDTLSQ